LSKPLDDEDILPAKKSYLQHNLRLKWVKGNGETRTQGDGMWAKRGGPRAVSPIQSAATQVPLCRSFARPDRAPSVKNRTISCPLMANF